MTTELRNNVDFKKLNNFMKTFVGKKNTFRSQLRLEQLADLDGPLHPQQPRKTRVQDTVYHLQTSSLDLRLQEQVTP